jgi:hypothetical protein
VRRLGKGSAAERFIRTIEEYFSAGGLVNIRLESAGTDATGAVVVLYREQPDGPLLGRRFEMHKYAVLFDPKNEPEDLAMIALSDEILDPSGHGRRLNVDWANGLADDPAQVEWHGIAVTTGPEGCTTHA